MLEYYIIAIVALCLCSVFFFVYKWYATYARIKGLALNDIFGKGYYRPKYIDPKESDFSEQQVKALNIWVYLIFTFMGVGFVLAMFFKGIS